ncbi:MAG: CapA family protein [Faecousia sp.]
MEILIGADLVPTQPNWEAFAEADTHSILGQELRDLMGKADFRVFNLEAPLTDEDTPIAKCGPCLRIPTRTAPGLRAMGVDLVTLANNHILDQGEAGLRSTISTLERVGISWIGAGMTPREAAKPYILEREGIKVGFYPCAEHEFSIVTENSAGANPFDPLWSLDHIRELKQQCDYVAVLYHGGREKYRYPSPELRKVCRRIADKGADLVLCQHSHCVGCQEEWNGSTIVYGQGNFLLGKSNVEEYQTGMLVKWILSSRESRVEYIPVEKSGAFVRLAGEEKAAEILGGFYKRSEEIKKPGFVEEAYARHARESVLEYYGRTLGRARYVIFRVLNLLCMDKLRRYCYSQRDILALENLLMCEAHREIYSAGLHRIISEKNDK